MRKIIIFILLIGALLAGIFYSYEMRETEEVVVADYNNASYVIDGQSVTLVNGVSEVEADPVRMSLTMKTWQWEKVEFSDGKIVEPKKKDAFTVTFKNDGSFNATTDCNTMGGKYVATKDTISLSDIFSTKMYCEGSQENEFSSLLNKTTQYLFTSKGELVLLLNYDSGSVYLK